MNGKIIRVAGIDYTVEVTPKLSAIDVLWGKVMYGDASIQIAEGLGEERKANVLIHELTHAIFYEAGFGEQDEDMINRVGNVLHQVLRDNDFGFLQEKSTVTIEVDDGKNFVREVLY